MNPKRAKRLRRRARSEAAVAVNLADLAERMANPPKWQPFVAHVRPCGSDPVVADLMRRLDVQVAAGQTVPSNLVFPGSGFGCMANPKPLAVVALLGLWQSGQPFAAPCPACGGLARILFFGGGLAMGSGRFVCSACAAMGQQPGSGSRWSGSWPKDCPRWPTDPPQPADAFVNWLEQLENGG